MRVLPSVLAFLESTGMLPPALTFGLAANLAGALSKSSVEPGHSARIAAGASSWLSSGTYSKGVDERATQHYQ